MIRDVTGSTSASWTHAPPTKNASPPPTPRSPTAVAKVATSEDWQNLLRISGSFHRYSPNNQLLLAAQGAEGLVASFHTWKQITATDGQPCRIRKGETALRVYAPIRAQARASSTRTPANCEPAPSSASSSSPSSTKANSSPHPTCPPNPSCSPARTRHRELWEAIAEQINAAGFTLERGPIDGPDGAKGVTNFLEKTVTVRDDLAPAQALKTQIHELGHVLMHADAKHASRA